MKKLNWLMMLMTALTLSFAACTDEPTTEQPGPGNDDPVEELTFQVSVAETTRTSAFINVIPSDLEAEYMSVIYPLCAAPLMPIAHWSYAR